MGCRFMSQQDAVPHISQARQSFRGYVQNSISLYRQKFVSLVMHNMIHVRDDVEDTVCNMNELSAFCFESHSCAIGESSRCPRFILTQYCNRMREEEEYLTQEKKSNRIMNLLLSVGGKVKNLKYKRMVLADSHPNNTVLLKNQNVAAIQRFNFDSKAKT
ncbi:hypothetical protein QAD02_002952 [Eretmocerus hayati]|uniref:Uncharacterized protein n=1 Tax=Eretmocerus hayati TaxID=131215 RepID=A0ACC2NKG5_9HYME|nr:hypothetical protein QAD02_002952 [Eretmocerus hayati]